MPAIHAQSFLLPLLLLLVPAPSVALRPAARAPRGVRGGALPPLSMGWGADLAFHKGEVVSSAAPYEGSKLIKVQVPEEVAKAHLIPGQFVQLKAETAEQPGFFAIANAPAAVEGPTVLEFLVKEAESSANDWLLALGEGATVEVSDVMGSGFRIQEHLLDAEPKLKEVLLIATGTGVAPMRAVINSGVLQGVFEAGGKGTLLVGARTEAALPFGAEFDDWKAKGWEVKTALSKGAAGKKYVQDVLKEEVKLAAPDASAALIVGQKGCWEECREELLARGVAETRVRNNF
mmetsp:Transcript_7747/g.26309  ORF Transcript_7747/g.26309 Transcript_7747/m.26309 type:complete len:290 (+) Transcript_7747:100-969(+)|eukprot:CAMPEP_0198442042 /NCGR_PEP_ID=MMETSP1452-20131203/65082_1 /TAXON_ID=1181717 /ORGANISM="Synchroma pusillum, Strain CCMP3072" /LENGTH=289 /DNA_ID=CAMNT_0044162673 /DNA_START=32 /DNA_END=901 /DNA_ORIENTATION=+